MAALGLLGLWALAAVARAQSNAAASTGSSWAGDVLIAGGWGHSPTVELYDPQGRKFRVAGKMDLFFAGVEAIELGGPEVLLIGGRRQDFYEVQGG